MLNTTYDALRAVLRADPTVGAADRNHKLALLRTPDVPKSEPAAPTVQRILQRRETAQRFNRTLRYVDRLAQEGILKKVKLPGRKRAVGFREEDVNRLIAAS